MAQGAVGYELSGEVAVLRIDDGKANALSHAVLGALRAFLDDAEKEARAVLIAGRPGLLSAGFDLAVMRSGPEAVRELVTAGAELLLREYTYPLPVVVACSGHALAAGALLLLASDARIGAEGEFKIGLNEVAIGMTLPMFAVELARDRISKRHFTRATLQAEIYAPAGALDAGFLDRVTRPEVLFEEALGEARRLAGLPQPAFRNTRERTRGATVERIRANLADDVRQLSGPATSS